MAIESEGASEIDLEIDFGPSTAVLPRTDTQEPRAAFGLFGGTLPHFAAHEEADICVSSSW
jgi:hypothetical protein